MLHARSLESQTDERHSAKGASHPVGMQGAAHGYCRVRFRPAEPRDRSVASGRTETLTTPEADAFDEIDHTIYPYALRDRNALWKPCAARLRFMRREGGAPHRAIGRHPIRHRDKSDPF
jgi:hypothetical protein